jgi:hypothetical protein
MVGLHVGGCNKVPPSHNQLVKDGGGGGGRAMKRDAANLRPVYMQNGRSARRLGVDPLVNYGGH